MPSVREENLFWGGATSLGVQGLGFGGVEVLFFCGGR